MIEKSENEPPEELLSDPKALKDITKIENGIVEGLKNTEHKPVNDDVSKDPVFLAKAAIMHLVAVRLRRRLIYDGIKKQKDAATSPAVKRILGEYIEKNWADHDMEDPKLIERAHAPKVKAYLLNPNLDRLDHVITPNPYYSPDVTEEIVAQAKEELQHSGFIGTVETPKVRRATPDELSGLAKGKVIEGKVKHSTIGERGVEIEKSLFDIDTIQKELGTRMAVTPNGGPESVLAMVTLSRVKNVLVRKGLEPVKINEIMTELGQERLGRKQR